MLPSTGDSPSLVLQPAEATPSERILPAPMSDSDDEWEADAESSKDPPKVEHGEPMELVLPRVSRGNNRATHVVVLLDGDGDVVSRPGFGTSSSLADSFQPTVP